MNDTEKELLKKEVIAQEESKQIKYMVEGQEVTLSIPIIRKYIVPNSPNITNAECMRFLQICKLRKLNPFIGDVDLVKYGTMEASIIVKKEYFVKQARKNPDFDGMEAGITIKTKDGKIEEREGAIVYDDEILVGGWCRAYLKTNKYPSVSKVSIKEYIGKKKDGSTNRQWEKMPATMIRKVAVAQALREAFPNLFNGLYDESEISKMQLNDHENAKEGVQEDFKNMLNTKNKTIEGEAEEVIEKKPQPDKMDDLVQKEFGLTPEENPFNDKAAEKECK